MPYLIEYSLISEYGDNRWIYYGYAKDKKILKEFAYQRNPRLYRYMKCDMEDIEDHYGWQYVEDQFELRMIPVSVDSEFHNTLFAMTEQEFVSMSIDYEPINMLISSPVMDMKFYPKWEYLLPDVRESLDILLYTSVFDEIPCESSPPVDELPPNWNDVLQHRVVTPLGRKLTVTTNIFEAMSRDLNFRFSQVINRSLFGNQV